MKGMHRVLVVAALACAVGVVLMLKRERQERRTAPPAPPAASATSEATGASEETSTDESLPRLVDLGAGKCIPCKMMAPILEELSKEYADTFGVRFIDVWEDPKAGDEYGIRMIPTQIFYDATGKELFRHEGFFGKEDILAKWEELGVAVATEPKE